MCRHLPQEPAAVPHGVHHQIHGPLHGQLERVSLHLQFCHEAVFHRIPACDGPCHDAKISFHIQSQARQLQDGDIDRSVPHPGPVHAIKTPRNHGKHPGVFLDIQCAPGIRCHPAQMFLLQKTGEAETITTHYLLCLGSYRALYLLNWVYRYLFSRPPETVVVLAGILQTVLYSDFFYIYYKRVFTGRAFKLPI